MKFRNMQKHDKDCHDKVPQTFFPHNSGGWKSETKVSAGLVSSEVSSWLADGLLPVFSHGPLSVSMSKFPLLIRKPVILD